MESSQAEEHETGPDQQEVIETALRLVSSAQEAIREMEIFRDRLQTRESAMNNTGIPSFIRTIAADCDAIQRCIATLNASPTPEDTISKSLRQLDGCSIAITQSLRHWTLLKKCRSFIATNRTFQGSSRAARKQLMEREATPSGARQARHHLLRGQARVEVDVVEGGREWVALRAMQRERLARQMSDAGWLWEEHERGEEVEAEEWEDVPLVGFVRKLIAAARLNRCEYRFPRIRVVLFDRLWDNTDFAVLSEQIQRMDPGVDVTIEDIDGPLVSGPAPQDLETAVQRMMGDPLEGLTQTLNLDHTILVDLASDLTHLKLEPKEWMVASTRAQIEEENGTEGGRMMSALRPVLEGRRLVCTREAAEHFHQVLRLVGTETERHRARLLIPLSHEDTNTLSPTTIRTHFQLLSIHAIPPTLQLPITVLPLPPCTPLTVSHAVTSGRLPPSANGVVQRSGWRGSKLSIWMAGWEGGWATVTSNREIRGQIRTLVEECRVEEGERGPRVWRVDVTRNLLAKHARPRGGEKEIDEAG